MESSTTRAQSPKFVRWAVVIGIMVVLNVFFSVVRAIIFPAPQYEDFCPYASQPAPMTQGACTAENGIWNPIPTPADTKVATVPAGYCDLTTKCQPAWDKAQKAYDQKAFSLMIGFGVVALIIGILPIGSSIVSAGLSYGGVLALIIGSGEYWSEAGNWLRLAITLIALLALLYIGLKRFRD